jgi:hypothetical protein
MKFLDQKSSRSPNSISADKTRTGRSWCYLLRPENKEYDKLFFISKNV